MAEFFVQESGRKPTSTPIASHSPALTPLTLQALAAMSKSAPIDTPTLAQLIPLTNSITDYLIPHLVNFERPNGQDQGKIVFHCIIHRDQINRDTWVLFF